MTTIHIACSAKNAGRWLDAFLDGLVAQTHGDWALWIRDDGSTDDSWARIEKWRAREPRVVFATRGSESLGLVQGFAYVLARIPAEARAIATADADDVWMPTRLERTLAALEEAEHARPGPTLVHSDLVVVDDQLRPVAPSFWASQRIDPGFPSIRSLAIQNVVVGPTLLFNAELLAELRSFPKDATNHDRWIALVAAVTGRLVAVREPTVWYRQHGANSTAGARRDSTWSRLTRAMRARATVAHDVNRVGLQATALLARFDTQLDPADRQALQGLALIVALSGWRRKIAIVRWRWLASHGVLRNLGVLFRG